MKAVVRTVATALLGALPGALPSGLAVFLYHDVTDQPSPFSARHGLFVAPETFRAQVRAIREDFNVVSIDNVLNGDWPERSALITFDDGFASVFEEAQPILRDANVPAVVFLNMDPIINRNPCRSALVSYLCYERDDFAEPGVDPFLYVDEVRLLEYLSRRPANCSGYAPRFASVNDLKSAEDRGTFAFGNHLFRHFNAENLSDGDLRTQLDLNARELATYSNSRPIMSYPFGQPRTCYSERTHRVVRAAGCKLLFSAMGRVNGRGADLLHRFVPRGDGRNDIRGNMVWDHYRRLKQ